MFNVARSSLCSPLIIDRDDRYQSRSKYDQCHYQEVEINITSFMTMCGASSPLAQQFSLFEPFVFVARFTLSFSGFGKLAPRVAYFIYEHLSKLAVI